MPIDVVATADAPQLEPKRFHQPLELAKIDVPKITGNQPSQQPFSS
jgi:hypothetical protein